MPEFTKGKWTVEYGIDITSDIRKDVYIAQLYCRSNLYEQLANARLITAAPEMYELLEECTNKLHSFDDTYRRIEALLNHIDSEAANHEE